MRWMFALVLAACSGSPRKTPPPSNVDFPSPSVPVDAAPDATVEGSIELGTVLYETKACLRCHSIDGSASIGPTMRGYWGTTVQLADGSSVVVDEAYVRESILAPLAKLRPSFPQVMPAYEGVLQPDELASLVAYIRSLR